MLLSTSSFKTPSAPWPVNLSKITSAGWSDGSLSSSLFLVTNSFYVCFHGAFVRPMVVAVCDVPIIWEADRWNTSMGFTLVNELWMKEDSCKRCSKNRCYLSFIAHYNNLNSCRPFILNGPLCHWYIVDTSLVPVSRLNLECLHLRHCRGRNTMQ